jgi:hypothetical protein
MSPIGIGQGPEAKLWFLDMEGGKVDMYLPVGSISLVAEH